MLGFFHNYFICKCHCTKKYAIACS